MKRLSRLSNLSPIAMIAVLIAIGLALAGGLAYQPISAQGEPTPVQKYAGKVRAPEFPDGLEWINVEKPLSIAALRGKVVLLDFWTYGCINCIHIIPDLKRLEAEFPNELVVIGVHSAKFPGEGQNDNLRQTVQRYGLEHPVVNDKDFQIWQAYGVRAWPTIMIIDPQGKVLGYHSGERVYDAVQGIVAGMIKEFDALSQIDRTPIPLKPDQVSSESNQLSFPAKVLADPIGQRLFISDTNHHRIIVADLATYAIQAVIGSGTAGLADGDFGAATFNWPHGLAVQGDMLYVADTRNHAIRAIDLKAGAVTTIAGTGQQSEIYGGPGGVARETALNSPWDIVYLNDKLYIAMAGFHQLWMLDLQAGTVAPHAGNGREEIDDGPLADATLAQPSSIATDGQYLYFADAESSSIRRADIAPGGSVRTIVGAGLFEFGDTDGVGPQVRLQHAQGLTVGTDGDLYIADTYNHKIKRIKPSNGDTLTVFGGERGLSDTKPGQFWEPGGISFANGILYIADTNNHRIRTADLVTGEVKTVVFPNPEKLAPPISVDAPPAEFYGEIVQFEPITAGPGAGQFVFDILLPEGYKMNNQAPFTLKVYNDNPVAKVASQDNDLSIVEPAMPIKVPVTLAEGSATITIDTAIFYCEAKNESLCFPLNARFVIPLTVSAGADNTITIRYQVKPPQLQ